MHNEMNAVDLAFVVDTTGSMGHLILAAQQQMIALLQELVQVADINLWLGVVEYRDHPPQDTTVYKVHAFTDTFSKAQKTIMSLKAEGGGDMPEAVLDGLVAACSELDWWKHSHRLIVLLGDAPPHGVGASGDTFPQGCPCGETIASVTRLAEEKHITIHALGMQQFVQDSFHEISSLTGGKYFSSQDGGKAIEQIGSLLKMEFANLALDHQVLDLYRQMPTITVEELAEHLGTTRHAVSASFVRLLSRELIEIPITQ